MENTEKKYIVELLDGRFLTSAKFSKYYDPSAGDYDLFLSENTQHANSKHFQSVFTEEEIKAIDPRFMAFAKEIKKEEVL